MKNNNSLNMGLVIAGALIVCALILSYSINNSQFNLNGDLSGNLNGNLYGELSLANNDDNTDDPNNKNKNNPTNLIMADEAKSLIYYDGTIDAFLSDIKSGKLTDFPYIKMKENYVFSRKAIEDWVYKQSLKQTIIK